MSIEAQLIETYNVKLMSNADVRLLMASVSQDPQTESVDMKKSKNSVRKVVDEIVDIGTARRQIIGWLNMVYFSITTIVSPDQYQITMSTPSTKWWWEMNTRIQKILIVAMILEGDNLRSFGATPETMDIPQCLVGVYQGLQNHRKHFPSYVKNYKSVINDLDPIYIQLYTQK